MADINWEGYSAWFDDGLIPCSDVVSTVFIIVVAFAGLYIARWMYGKL